MLALFAAAAALAAGAAYATIPDSAGVIHTSYSAGAPQARSPVFQTCLPHANSWRGVRRALLKKPCPLQRHSEVLPLPSCPLP